MADYIDREDVLDAIKKYFPRSYQFLNVFRDIKDLPAADVAEVRHAQWKACFEDWRKQIEGDECSACSFKHYGTNIRNYNYCPNCGARMDGVSGRCKG